MADEEPAVTDLLRDLTMELRRLNREVEPEGGPRLPTRQELSRLTSEVAIPGLILLLRTQIRALELLRRAIRIADGREPTGGETASQVRNRAEQLGETTLAQLDVVLEELQAAVEARPEEERARELIDEARDIQGRIRSELDAEPADADTAVGIDVESELQRLKDDVEDADNPDDADGGGSGTGRQGAGEGDGEDSGNEDGGPDENSDTR